MKIYIFNSFENYAFPKGSGILALNICMIRLVLDVMIIQ